MAFDKTNTFTLGKNNRKGKDTHPDYSGSINIDGDEYWLSAWLKTSSSGEKFFSGTVKPKPTLVPNPKPPVPEFNDDIPF